jgi:hypothetical protein
VILDLLLALKLSRFQYHGIGLGQLAEYTEYDFMSVFWDPIPVVFPTQKYHINTSPVLDGHGATNI